MFRNQSISTRIFLAVLPAATILVVLFLLEAFSKQQVLFALLASSAFLIYLDPEHPINSFRTLVIAQMLAAVIGFVLYLLVGRGYAPAALSMVAIIVVMIIAKAMHPPAVSSALTFAFQTTKPNTLLLFLMAVLLLVILIVLQRTSLWIIKRAEKKLSTKT